MKIGDRVIAVRKVASRIYQNTVMGTVVEVWDNACAVQINIGKDTETSFKMHFNDWTFLGGVMR